MKRKILDFPIQHARLIFVGLAVLTIGLGSAIPWIQVDTDPENMLSEDDPARVFHNECTSAKHFGQEGTFVKRRFMVLA